jgi:flagellar hook assembly protein FlgD
MNGNLQLMIYSINGMLVKTLVNQDYSPGTYSIIWDGTNHLGSPASAGIYLYQITYSQGYTLDYQEVKKLILLK